MTQNLADRSVLTIRLNPLAHRAISVAASRSGKTVNTWAVDVLSAAATTSNAAFLTWELARRGMEGPAQEISKAGCRLLAFAGIAPTGAEGVDFTSKLEATLHSLIGGFVIQAKKSGKKNQIELT